MADLNQGDIVLQHNNFALCQLLRPCGIICANRNTLHNHLMTAHGYDQTVAFQIANAVYQPMADQNQHDIVLQPDGTALCQILHPCGKLFANPNTLRNHLITYHEYDHETAVQMATAAFEPL